MNNKNFSKLRMAAIITAIAFIAYNAVLFSICGFADHGKTFWISYAFMMAAFLTLAVSCFVLKIKSMRAKDWLLIYPALKYCCAYLVLEAIASVTFIILDYIKIWWVIAFSVQTVLLAIHLILIISSIMGKTIIEDVAINVKQNTSYIKLLRLDAEMIAEKSNDIAVKSAYSKLSEQLRYSDPTSNEALSDIDAKISNTMMQAKANTDNNELITLCEKLSVLITERNKMCKLSK